MTQTLRYYQEQAFCSVVEAQAQGWKSVLVTQATGTGKTTVAAELTRYALLHGKRVLFVAHTQELIGQALRSLQRHCGLDEFDIAPEINVAVAPHSCRVVVGSLMTIKNPSRLYWFRPDVVIYDEAHRCGSDTHKGIKSVYPEAFHIGVTATPKRGDRQALHAFNVDGSPALIERNGVPTAADVAEAIFEKHVFAYGLKQAQRDGWIVPFRWQPVQTNTDISRVKLDKRGDLAEKDLANQIDNAERTNLLINAWMQETPGQQTVMFCASVEHAVHSTELWRQAGIHAECIVSKEPEDPAHKALVTTESSERFRVLAEFNARRFPVVVNYGTLTEGVDVPACSCIIMARPTNIWSLYTQCIGRGGRPLSGLVDGLETAEERRWAIETSDKPFCTVLECQDISGKHNPMQLPDLLDLPAHIAAEDVDLTEARRLLAEEKEKQREAEEVERKKREQVIAPLVVGFGKATVTLGEPTSEIRTQERAAQVWKATETGYALSKGTPGYANNLQELEGGWWSVYVTGPDGSDVFNKAYRFDKDKHEALTPFLERIAVLTNRRIAEHSDAADRAATFHALKPLDRWILNQGGVSNEQIRRMTLAEAKGKLTSLRIAYRAERMKAEREAKSYQQQEAA